MRLLFKQRIFSWLDSYDIYDENGRIFYTVKGRLGLRHAFDIYDKNNYLVGQLFERFYFFVPRFVFFQNNTEIGDIVKTVSLFKPHFELNFNDWKVDGSFTQWNYTITRGNGSKVATITKDLFHMSDHYIMDISNESDALYVLLITISIDAIKCSQNS